tara:strand:- start:923 stop:1543 length:621 start_codon:yes stop_codon:yes gene_type:complete
MRLIKAQTTNLRSIYGKGVKYDVDDQVILDSTHAMLVPKGRGPLLADQITTDPTGADQRPTSSVNGQLRYNTSTNQLEAYQNNAWREIRFKEPNQDSGTGLDSGIRWQNLGVGNASADETVFGELQSNDPNYPVPAFAENILVMIENVLQIPQTNYTIHQTAEITSGGAEEGPNHPYTASGTGWWIKFKGPVPTGKPVTVIHNFDK